MVEAMRSTLGNVTQACKQVGISRKQFYKYYNGSEKFRKQIDDLVNEQKDFVESKLLQNIDEGKETSIIFYLKTRAKDRGYVERQEVEHSGDLEIKGVDFGKSK